MRMDAGLDTKICSKCAEEKDFPLCFVKSKYKAPKKFTCKSCKNEAQRVYREETGSEATKNYEKTSKGYLMRTYRNMESRVKGIQKKKAHLYKGLPILDREEFYNWSYGTNYLDLLGAYKDSGYDTRLAPSIDRKDPSEGYVLGNIRWLTHSENSSLGAISRNSKYRA